MKKKIVLTIATAVAAIALVGCGVTTTTTYTETTTDANGNTISTTTTTTNGQTTTETTQSSSSEPEMIVATIAFENETNFDFAALYFSPSEDDNWGEDILGDLAPLAVGEKVTYENAITFPADDGVWDIRAKDADGNTVDFEGVDMLTAADPTNVYITFEYDDATQSYTAYID